MSNLQAADAMASLEAGEFDFLDFGCSSGGSIRAATKIFGARRGLGIDISENKVAQATAAGYDAIVFNIHDLPGRPLVRFCVMSHFLEHIPNRIDVIAFLRKASEVSKEFIYIRQPYFDADGYLFQKGLKLYWSDWRGHPNPLTTLGFYTILTQLRIGGQIGNFSIHLSGSLLSSADKAIHPRQAPRDQHDYDQALHGEKPADVPFDIPVFKDTVVLISKPGVEHYQSFKNVKYDRTIFDSTAST